MERVIVTISSSGVSRGSEIVADLREVAESLFHPLRVVAYWDTQGNGRHVCPQEDRKEPCPHMKPNAPTYERYPVTVATELNGELEVFFPHADVSLFLGPPPTLAETLRKSRGR